MNILILNICMSVAEIDQRVILHYKMPLASILTDFYDKLKSLSSGYASLNYEFMRLSTG